MRNDLTIPFIEAMGSGSRTPIQIIVFHFGTDDQGNEIGDIKMSDRDIDLHGVEYQGLVEDWGTINTAAAGTNDLLSETLQMTISIWNGGETPFSNLFLLVDPVDVPVDVYQTFEGLEEEDIALVGSFVIQDPIVISEVSRLLVLDLVTINMRYTSNVGKVLSKEDWPNALEGDINKGINLIVGDTGSVQTLAARVPLYCTQKGSVLKLPTIIHVHENLDDLGWPATGFLTIDDETMHYNGRDEDSFFVDLRAQLGTFATEHSDGTTVQEFITDHTYIIGQGPITSISDVKAGGLPVDPSEYTVDLAADPAIITFAKQPQFISYSKGARSIDADFDNTGINNTAFQPHYAYDNEFKSYGALLSENYRTLSVDQLDTAVDEGEVVRVFLAVEHWETKIMPNDSVNVWVDGLGVIGQLSKPNAADVTTIEGEIDIDHGHDHITGGNHDHGFSNPGLGTSNPAHDHTLSATKSLSKTGSPSSFSHGIGSNGAYGTTKSTTIWFNGLSAEANSSIITITTATQVSGGTYDINFVEFLPEWGTNLIIDQFPTEGLNGTININGGAWLNTGYTDQNYSMKVRTALYVNNASITIYYNNPFIQYAALVEETNDRTTSISTSHTSTGDVQNRSSDTSGLSLKDLNDVDSLSEENRQLENIVTTTSSKKVIDKFDLTKYLETISWAWMTGRNVQLQYVGNDNNADVIVTYIWFEVEYRQRQIQLTNDVTVKPVGSIGNRPDEVIQYLLGNVAGVPIELMGSVWTNPERWDDTNIWDDTDTWIDSGEALSAPAGAAFVDAANRYEFLKYKFDGVIPADVAVKDAVKELCKQARGRLIWSAGQVKLAVKEKSDGWVPVKELGPSETQLRSIIISKEQVDRVRNDIDLFYKFDRISTADTEGAYDATVSKIDQPSIDKHGQKKENSDWLFNMVRDDDMALDLVDYYLWRQGEPATVYNFNVYLQQFDLEKEDAIRFSSNYFRLEKLPLKIQDNPRTIGSGKLNRMNMIDITGTSVRHRLLTLFLDSQLMVFDDIEVGVDDFQDSNDTAGVVDEILITEGKFLDDQVSAVDEIFVRTEYGSTLIDQPVATDEIAVTFSMELFDTFSLADDFEINQELCFGACGFGSPDSMGCPLPFGAKTVHFDKPFEELLMVDELTTAMQYNLVFEDTIQATDEILVSEHLADSVSFSEELIFNTCFGARCEIGGTGFGQNNFGG